MLNSMAHQRDHVFFFDRKDTCCWIRCQCLYMFQYIIRHADGQTNTRQGQLAEITCPYVASESRCWLLIR